MLRPGFGTFVQWHHDDHIDMDYCTISLKCIPDQDQGKYLKIQDDGNDVEWVDLELNSLKDVAITSPSNKDLLLYNSTTNKWENGEIPGIQEYPTMTSSNHANGTPYVINGGGQPYTYLDSNGEWTTPNGTTYSAGEGIAITGNTNSININTTGASNGNALIYNSTSGHVEWGSVLGNYEAGAGIDINSNHILCNIESTDTGTPSSILNIRVGNDNNSILITDEADYNK